MKVKDLILRPSKVSQRDKQLLLAHLLGVKAPELYLKMEEEVPLQLLEEYEKSIKKLEEGYPLQYLIGEWDFYGRTFKVVEGVLIPRPETELLVEKTLELLDSQKDYTGLEIGVGSGCIAITLLLERERLFMYGTDINPRALELTRINAENYGVSQRLKLLQGKDFEPVKGLRFDFVVSNPPYIPEGLWETLPEGVKLEGKDALIGGKKGWEFYERFAQQVGDFLKEKGFFVLEIGHDQGQIVRELLKDYSPKIFKDYSGQDRVVVGWKS
ncbi:MAG: peptide chain release factor N(5)-glutamine methyltransferase [Thermocrinis sp.]|nr:peptide chain release factor N(5)-glutamine methyltransferase [Thermocrinis sp.]